MSSGATLVEWNDANITKLTKDAGAIIIHDYELFSGVSLSDHTINSGATIYVDRGASFLNGQVQTAGEIDNDKGTISKTKVEAGGYLQEVGGVDVGVTLTGVVGSGTPTSGKIGSSLGVEGVFLGTASATRVSSGGYLEETDGRALSTIVFSGGVLEVDQYGRAISATVNSGGELLVYSGAIVTWTQIEVGAIIDFGGVGATSAAISGGELVAYSSGTEVAAIGIAGATTHLTFRERGDGHGGAEFVVNSTAAVMTNAIAAFPVGGAAALDEHPWSVQNSSAVLLADRVRHSAD